MKQTGLFRFLPLRFFYGFARGYSFRLLPPGSYWAHTVKFLVLWN